MIIEEVTREPEAAQVVWPVISPEEAAAAALAQSSDTPPGPVWQIVKLSDTDPPFLRLYNRCAGLSVHDAGPVASMQMVSFLYPRPQSAAEFATFFPQSQLTHHGADGVFHLIDAPSLEAFFFPCAKPLGWRIVARVLDDEAAGAAACVIGYEAMVLAAPLGNTESEEADMETDETVINTVFASIVALLEAAVAPEAVQRRALVAEEQRKAAESVVERVFKSPEPAM